MLNFLNIFIFLFLKKRVIYCNKCIYNGFSFWLKGIVHLKEQKMFVKVVNYKQKPENRKSHFWEF
ncbi:hypothetical protein pE33L466_0045 (plasmid) [Bacillus cereus E33L]|uniref:Uncharacterized protein n=1 Tax=Bacillus cereus (strain ZK / E33L) TaxID=288681 RepID=Q4V245_BACCZ|nr:hypothetical protein pE33L466_0045 [Bacillus cereus E33L]